MKFRNLKKRCSLKPHLFSVYIYLSKFNFSNAFVAFNTLIIITDNATPTPPCKRFQGAFTIATPAVVKNMIS